jgi:hypothetical protein
VTALERRAVARILTASTSIGPILAPFYRP